MPETLSTSFRVVSRKSGINGETINSKRLIARQAPDGKFCVREQKSSKDSECHGGQGVHPFPIKTLFMDWLNKYPDYTLSYTDVNVLFRKFEEEHPENADGLGVAEGMHLEN